VPVAEPLAPGASTADPALTAVLHVVPLVTARALDAPLHYAAPATAAGGLPIGAVVDAPLGTRTLRGVVVGTGRDATTPAELRPVADTGERVPPDLVALALQIADRYATPAARALALVLPPRTAPSRVLWASAAPTARAGGDRQRAVLAALADGPLPVPALRAAPDVTAEAIRRLVKSGDVLLAEPSAALLGADLVLTRGPQLTEAQQRAVERILAALETPPPERALLLHGVTGSG